MTRFLTMNEPREMNLVTSPTMAVSTCHRETGRAQSTTEETELLLLSANCTIFQKEFSLFSCFS